MVPQAPPPIASGAAGRPDGEVARAFRVLRNHRQFAEPEQLSAPREARLAQVAQSPLEQGLHRVGAVRRSGAALPAATGATESRPPGHVANSWPEEPDARIGPVRICGGPGRETTLGYPTVLVRGLGDGPGTVGSQLARPLRGTMVWRTFRRL